MKPIHYVLIIGGVVVFLCVVVGVAVVLFMPAIANTEQATGPPPAPLRFAGTTSSVETFESTNASAIKVEGFHFGKSIFVVKVKASDGHTIDIPVHCPGDCIGEGITKLQGNGTYYLEITADDEWEIDVIFLQ